MLPRQFHVAVVENNNENEIKRAVWLYPVYLVLINLFVVPIALAGLLTFPTGSVDSDMFVLALPLQSGSNLFTIVAFVGGLSAATAMVIVKSVALSIMVSNDLIMPLVLQRREALISGRGNVGSLLLTVRRISIFAILLLAYVYYRSAGEAQLASIGLLSFAAIAQLAPAFFGGLRVATRHSGRRHCRHDRRLSRLGLYPAASDAVRHRRDRRTHSHRRAGRPEHVASAAFVWPRPSATCSWRGVEPPDQYRCATSASPSAARPHRSSGSRPIRSCLRISRRFRPPSGVGVLR